MSWKLRDTSLTIINTYNVLKTIGVHRNSVLEKKKAGKQTLRILYN